MTTPKPPLFLNKDRAQKCPFRKEVKIGMVTLNLKTLELRGRALTIIGCPCHHCNIVWRSEGELPPCEW